MRVTSRILLLLLYLVRSGAASGRVSARDGRVVFTDPSGQETELTQSGYDSAPWISPDGRTVVFLRHPAGDVFRNAIYKIDLPSGGPKLIYAGPARYEGREGSYFGRPELDESHNTLYLISNEYATSGALLSVRLGNGQVTFISDGVVGYDVIVCPRKYRGDLLALKRYEEDLLGRPYFLYSRYSPTGEDLGLAGADELDVDMIRGGTCDEPDRPQGSSPPASSSGAAVRVDGSVMDRRLVTRVDPVYPSQAKSDNVEGDVRLDVRVAADGTVDDVSLVSGPPQLVGAARDAVKQWRYRPVITSGHPVAVLTIVDIRFRLPSPGKSRVGRAWRTRAGTWRADV